MPSKAWRTFLATFHIAALLSLTYANEGVSGGSPPLRYRVTEESPRGTLVGNILEDAGLGARYSPEILPLLRFRFLTESNPMFAIGSTSGVIATAGDIDRDSQSLCRQKEHCEMNLDVVIQPVQYFLIVKVIVEIVDINDNSPKFRELRISLPVIEAAQSVVRIFFRRPSTQIVHSSVCTAMSWTLPRKNSACLWLPSSMGVWK